MTDFLLDVPFYRQHDLDSELNSYWQNRSCGTLALKMVLDFYLKQTKQKLSDASKLFQQNMKHGGVNEGGDLFSYVFVKTAIKNGFIAWRRGWIKSKRDIATFKKEGVDNSSIKRWCEQEKSEAIPTLISSLQNGHPPIVSVSKNFDKIDRAHFVVLTGIKYGKAGKPIGFFYNDPYNPNKIDRKHSLISMPIFTDRWNYRAIFVEPKGNQ